MSPTNTEDIESQLRLRRDDILKQIRNHLHGSDEPDRQLTLGNHLNEVDDEPLGDAMNETGIAILTHEISELRSIDSALLRIADGTYGICKACGEPIPVERLTVQPATQCCLQCQENVEKHHGAVPSVLL